MRASRPRLPSPAPAVAPEPDPRRRRLLLGLRCQLRVGDLVIAAASTNRLLVWFLLWVRSSPSEQAQGRRCYACDSLAVRGSLRCNKASPAMWLYRTDAVQKPPQRGTAATAGIAAFARDRAPMAAGHGSSAGDGHGARGKCPSAVARAAAGPVPVAFLRMPGRQGYATSCAEFRGDYRDDASSLATIPSSSASSESARCCDAAQADDEIVARCAEPELAPLFEALWMLSCWPCESFRQNSCKRLRQRSDGLRIAFG